MKKLFNYSLCTLLLIACFAMNAGAQNTQATAKLHDYTIKIGDQTKLFLIVHQPAKEHVEFPKLADTLTTKIQVVGALKPDTVFEGSDKSRLTVTRSYLITAFDEGTYTIPPFSVITSEGVVKTNELTLQVTTVKVDTTKAIYDIKQPLAVSYTFWDWLKDNWYWVLLGLVIILAAIGTTWYFVKRPKAIPLIVKPEIILLPHTIALNKIQELRAKKIWMYDVKLHYSELSDVLREYLEKRYNVKTHEKTTEEIFTGLKRIQILEDQRGRLHQILTLSDLVKFAKENPVPAENEQMLDYATDFVTKTQPEVIAPKPVEGGTDGNV